MSHAGGPFEFGQFNVLGSQLGHSLQLLPHLVGQAVALHLIDVVGLLDLLLSALDLLLGQLSTGLLLVHLAYLQL